MKNFENLNEDTKEDDEKEEKKRNYENSEKHSSIHTDIEIFNSKKNKIMPQAKAKGVQPVIINDPQNKNLASKIKKQHQNGEKKIKQEIVDDTELKCKYAALVLDRLFFCIVSIYALITFIALIMSIPNFYK